MNFATKPEKYLQNKVTEATMLLEPCLDASKLLQGHRRCVQYALGAKDEQITTSRYSMKGRCNIMDASLLSSTSW